MKKIINKLEIYNHSFKIKDNRISVKLGLGLYCNIIFLKDNSYKITSSLGRWNLLTGIIKMNIKQSVIYNTLILLGMIGLQIYFDTKLIYPYLPFIVMSIFFIWYLYYLYEYYTFKQTLIKWLDKY